MVDHDWPHKIYQELCGKLNWGKKKLSSSCFHITLPTEWNFNYKIKNEKPQRDYMISLNDGADGWTDKNNIGCHMFVMSLWFNG